MGKFRSKIKGHVKGKRWRKGQSSSSNPSVQKYRNMAKSRFFQENIENSKLTQEALHIHNAMTMYGTGSKNETNFSNNELGISKGLENMAIEANELIDTESQADSSNASTFKTFQTFASDWSSCTNISFSKLLTKFNLNNPLHKEMLAILAAVTEVIKEQGGNESNTAYFAALLETLKATDTKDDIAATLSLLSMGMKSVPQPVLRKQFSDTAQILIRLLETYANSENGTILRCLIGCISVLLRAQEYALWHESSTIKVFESVLAFTIHSKPKVRKAAQHAVCGILRASCFMLPTENEPRQVIQLHPGASKVAALCFSQMTSEALIASQTSVLHTLTLLKEVIGTFNKDHIKTCCESLLSLMAHNNIIVKTSCLQVLYNLFASQNENTHLTATITIQLIRALTASRPGVSDSRQNLAWVTVMQQAFISLAKLDLSTCINALPGFVNICVTELWLCDAPEVINSTTNALRAVLMDCVSQAASNAESVEKYKKCIESIFNSIRTGLDNPFNQAVKNIILTIAVCFEIGTDHVKPLLAPLLKQLNERKESHNFHHNKEAEYATGCAIKFLGPEFVLACIPIKKGNTINMERTWLLPVMKEKIQNATLKFFIVDILELASICRRNATDFSQKGENAMSHTYDLLCGQFWALLPSFCNSPTDIRDEFKNIARVCGNIIKDSPEFRLSVMQGLRRLISSVANSDNIQDREELGRFAKNFLPRLLNVYMTPTNGNQGEGQRLSAFETIQVYLTISNQELRKELFDNAIEQLSMEEKDHFKREALLDIIRNLVLYQTEDEISHLFNKWVYPLCETALEECNFKKKRPRKGKNSENDNLESEITEEDAKAETHWKDRVKMVEMEHKKAYRILDEIFKCETDNCKSFLEQNRKKIQKLLIGSLSKAAESSKATRLRCIEHLIKLSPNLTPENKLLRNAVPEAVICTKDINTKCRQCAFNLLNTIGDVLIDRPGGLSAFVAMLEAGLEGPPRVTNATILALASVTYNFSGALGIETLQRILEHICKLVTSPSREIVSACLSYLKVYTKMLPSPVVAQNLPLIFASLSSMSNDCKKHSRVELGRFLCRMMRKYGSDTIDKLVPQSDEIMHKRLKNLRKTESRKRRQKEVRRSRSSDQDEEMSIKVKGMSISMDELLKDSDSELDFGEEDTKSSVIVRNKKPKSSSKNKAWIQDDAENIVDLTDTSAARRITATDPSLKKHQEAELQTERRKRKQGFKVAADGRLIISDKHMRGDSESETEKLQKRNLDDSDESDSEVNVQSLASTTMPRKRKIEDVMSIKTGKSVKSHASSGPSQPKYRPGGKGIHRPLSSTSSVYSKVGSEYKSKKAFGDVKKKGKPDPYAYLPLMRTSLNKRKKITGGKQFKTIMKNKTKGVKLKLKMKNRK